MDPSALVPTPDTLQVPWGWFQLLLLITLFFHIVLMNVMLGSAFITLVNHFRGSDATLPLTREISKKLPFAIAFTVNFGVAPLLFVQVLYGQFLYTSSVLMANFWLLIIGLLIFGYYMAYIYDYKFGALQETRVVIIGCTVLALATVGFFMTNNFTMLERPDVWTRYFESPDGLLLNLGDPTLFPRYLHMMFAAVAVGGLSIALYYEVQRRRGKTDAEGWVRYGCSWFGYATMANFSMGFWFYSSLPQEVRSIETTTGKLMAALLLVGVSLGGLSALYSLRGKVIQATFAILPAIFVMILIRNLTRVAYLKPYFSLSDLEVVPQYSPMILFLVIFIGGLYLLYWMFKLALRALENKEMRS